MMSWPIGVALQRLWVAETQHAVFGMQMICACRPGMKNFKPVKNGYKGDGVVRQGERVALSNRYAGLGE
jgi:hypothetical protein